MSNHSSEKLFTLAEAAQAYGVSLSTLRRRANEGSLETLPRAHKRAPVMTSEQALEAAGFRRPVSAAEVSAELEAVSNQMTTQIEALSNQVSALSAELELERERRASAELEASRARIEAAEQRGRAEIALELRPMLEQAIDRLSAAQAEVIAASRPVLEFAGNGQVSNQVTTQRRGLISRLRGR